MTETDLADLRRKWATYEKLLMEPEGDGSMLGRYFIIARSACTDIPKLLDALEGAK